MSLLSIVLPAYNEEAMLPRTAETLTGIIEQNWGGEGSTDYILRALDAFGRAGEANDNMEDGR